MKTREQLIQEANDAVSAFPQYRGRFDGMQVGVAKRDVTTKLGLAVAKGERVLFERNERDGDTFWSARNACLTGVPRGYIVEAFDAVEVAYRVPGKAPRRRVLKTPRAMDAFLAKLSDDGGEVLAYAKPEGSS